MKIRSTVLNLLRADRRTDRYSEANKYIFAALCYKRAFKASFIQTQLKSNRLRKNMYVIICSIVQ